MKIFSSQFLQGLSLTDPEQLRRYTTQALTNLVQVLQKNVNFTDNIQGVFVTAKIAGNNIPVQHNLGVVPIGYLLLMNDTSKVIYYTPSTTYPWTATQIYLSNSDPTTTSTIKIFLIGS